MAQDVIVRIQGLNKTFRGRAGTVVALNGIDLDIYRGEIFGIIGLSGAGKSTLVRCINFLEKPTEGTVTVDGQELGKLSKKQLLEARRSMGMIFQQFNLLQQRTALQNICFPLEIAGTSKADAEKRARELLEIVGLSDRADNYPSQLSGGQQQRVAIARALATNPKILLCDEATSALDPTTTRSIPARRLISSSTSKPQENSISWSSSGEMSMSTYSLSQLYGTFIVSALPFILELL